MADADLSKIIGLIMENPELIEQIKKLASDQKPQAEPKSVEIAEEVPEPEKQEDEAVNVSAEPIGNIRQTRRRELLSALKPYVSEQRGKAIESMISIADVLDMMRTK